MINPNDVLTQQPQNRDRPGFRTALKTWALRHAQVFFYSLGQLWRAPLSLLMTSAVIGIALALPAGLHVLLTNAQQLSGTWDGAAKLSVFLKLNTTDEQARALQTQIQSMPTIAEVQYISRTQALEEFKKQSGFGDALTALKDNPLPAVLVITPTRSHSEPAALDGLTTQLRGMNQVELVQLDRQWVKRLFAIMQIVARGIDVLAAMLALAVLLVVGNTIRLAIQNRREEIVVMKLIGGTDAFIRRPFLYTGFWYGLFGGCIALLLVYLAVSFLSGPVSQLSSLYQTRFELAILDMRTIGILLGSAIALGWLGSWVAVGRHLREIEPR